MKRFLIGLILLTIAGCSSSSHDRCVDNYMTLTGTSWWEKYTDKEKYTRVEFDAIRNCMGAASRQ
jgi:hypothetical protein